MQKAENILDGFFESLSGILLGDLDVLLKKSGFNVFNSANGLLACLRGFYLRGGHSYDNLQAFCSAHNKMKYRKESNLVFR